MQYIVHAITFSNNKEQNSNTCYNTDEPQNIMLGKEARYNIFCYGLKEKCASQVWIFEQPQVVVLFGDAVKL